MSSFPRPSGPKRFSRRRFVAGSAAAAAAAAAGVEGLRSPAPSAAGPQLPPGARGNPVVRENRLTPADSWTDGFALSGWDGRVCGFATDTSFDRGRPVPLKLALFDGDAVGEVTATLGVFRLGHYGGRGGRLVHTITGVPVGMRGVHEQRELGLLSCADWPVSVTLPSSVTDVTGVYLVKILTTDGKQNQIVFVVRDDARPRDLLVALPVNTWQAYNAWGGKSLYFLNSSAAPTVAGLNPLGHSRAVKVSFDRPYGNVVEDYNWVLHTEWPLIQWLERQGYDLTYTDDTQLHGRPEQLAPDRTRTLVIAGHSEYWTREMLDNVTGAVAQGTNLASFSANTAYWKVRYEDERAGAPRTMVCFKTVEGSGTLGSGAHGVNDFGPGTPAPTARGGPHDPLGPDGRAQTPDDLPAFATTTFRDPGAAPGDAQAPPEGRVGAGGPPGNAENALFGVLYVGDDDSTFYPLQVPPGSGDGGEFGAHPAWRHTPVDTRGTTIGTNLVGWEWDAVPGRSTPHAAVQPRGVKRLTQTDPRALAPARAAIEYLQDAGRRYGPRPVPSQGPYTQAVTHQASSGALVFASGTMQWSWGLAPHFVDGITTGYQQPATDSSDRRIQQATCNILADGGVRPTTPEDVILDRSPRSGPGA